jgi:hypothetical protein
LNFLQIFPLFQGRCLNCFFFCIQNRHFQEQSRSNKTYQFVGSYFFKIPTNPPMTPTKLMSKHSLGDCIMIRYSNSTESISSENIGLEFSSTSSQRSPKIWMGSKLFDLCFVTGGAFFTLAIAALAFARPSLLPVMFWLWVVVFEGSHFWATFTRTYLDRDFRANNKSILIGSLIFFLFPAIALIVDANLGSSQLAAT